MWLMQNYITGKNSYRLVGGKGSRPARTKLSVAGQIGAWLWVALVILVAVGVPYFSIIATSLIKLRGYGLAAGNFTRPLQGAADHAEGARLHPEEPVPRRVRPPPSAP